MRIALGHGLCFAAVLMFSLAGDAFALVPPEFDGDSSPPTHSIATVGSGSCCKPATGVCTDGVSSSACIGTGGTWSSVLVCCEVECRIGENVGFDSQNVALLSQVTMSDFRDFRGGATSPHTGNEMWGYTSPLGREYAIMSFTTGVGIVEITDPVNPTIIAYIDGEGIDTVWRDAAVYREYLYIVTDGGGVGMQVVDLSRIDSGVVTKVSTTDLGVGFILAHNVLVNEDSGTLFLAIANLNFGDGLVMFSLSNPASPQLVGSWTDAASNVRCHDAQVVSFSSGPNTGREIAFCFAEDDGLKIVDVTDKGNTFTVSTLSYPSVVYTHQGWVSEDGRYVFFGDELDEQLGTVGQTATYVVDVQNLTSPALAAIHFQDGCWIDHNMMVRGDRLYQAQYAAGLRILNISNPLAPVSAGYFDTRPADNQTGFPGAWGIFSQYQSRVLSLSDRQRGLFVLLDEPQRPVARMTSDRSTTDLSTPVSFAGGPALAIAEASAIVSWEWDFDYQVGGAFGVAETGRFVQHRFTAGGVFTVALRVTDAEGDQDMSTHRIIVDATVPAASTWSLSVMGLSILCAGTVLVRRNRARLTGR